MTNKPRNKHMNVFLLSRKTGAHTDKVGKHMSRSKAKQQSRKMIGDM